MAGSHEQNGGISLNRAEFLAKGASALGLLIVGSELLSPVRAESAANPAAAELVRKTDAQWSEALRRATKMQAARNPDLKPTPFTSMSGGLIRQYQVVNSRPAEDGYYYALTMIVPEKQLGKNQAVGPQTEISTFIDQMDDPKARSRFDNRFELARYPGSTSETYAVVFGSQSIFISADGSVGFLSNTGNELHGDHTKSRKEIPSFDDAVEHLTSYMDKAEDILKAAEKIR